MRQNKSVLRKIILSTALTLGLSAGAVVAAPVLPSIISSTPSQVAQAAAPNANAVDESGNAIKDANGNAIVFTIQGRAGRAITLNPDDYTIDGYTLKTTEVTLPKNGSVNLTFTKNEVIQPSTVTVNYYVAGSDQLITSETQSADYATSGNWDYKALPDDYKNYTYDSSEVATSLDGLTLTATKAGIAYDDQNKAGGNAVVNVYYKAPAAKAATVTINYIDTETGLTFKDPTVIGTASGLKVGGKYTTSLMSKYYLGTDYRMDFDHYQVEGATATDADRLLTLTDLKENNTIDAYYHATYIGKKPASKPNLTTYIPGVYAQASAGISLDSSHYTIVSAGAGVSLLGATAFSNISFTGLFGFQWQIGSRVYVGPLGVWIIAGIAPDNKLIVTPLSAGAEASASVNGFTSAISAGAAAGTSAFNGSAAGAVAGITTPVATAQSEAGVVATSTGAAATASTGVISSSSKDNVTDDVATASQNGSWGFFGSIGKAISNTANSLFGWLF